MKKRREASASPWHDLAARVGIKAQELGPQTCFLVTGCGRGEGQSTVVREVAALVAASGRKVGITQIRSPEPASSVSLAGRTEPVEYQPDARLGYACWTIPESFDALPPHAREPHLWVTPFDLMLIDAPPVGTFMQQHLTPLVAGVILIVDTRKRGLPELVRAAKTVAVHGGKLLGVVLNRHRSPLPRWLDQWGDRP